MVSRTHSSGEITQFQPRQGCGRISEQLGTMALHPGCVKNAHAGASSPVVRFLDRDLGRLGACHGYDRDSSAHLLVLTFTGVNHVSQV